MSSQDTRRFARTQPIHRRWAPAVGLAAALATAAGWFLAASPMLTLLAAGLGILICTAAWSPAIPLGAASLGYLAGYLAPAGSIPDNSTRAVTALWLVAAIGFALVRYRSVRFTTPLALTIGLGVALALLMTIRLSPDATDIGQRKTELVVLVCIPTLLAAYLTATQLKGVHLFAVVTASTGGLIAAVVLYGIFVGSLTESLYRRYSLDDQHPITLGRLASTAALASFYLALKAQSRSTRAIALSAATVSVLAMLTSGSRGPVISFALALAVAVALARAFNPLRIVVAGLALLALSLLATTTVDRPTGAAPSSPFALVVERGSSSNGRADLWVQAWDAFLQHPVTGLGTGGFATLRPTAEYPHNIALELASEFGLAGLLILLLFVSVTIHVVRSVWRGARKSGLYLESLFVISLLVLAISNVQVSGDLGINWEVWLALGLALGLQEQIQYRNDR